MALNIAVFVFVLAVVLFGFYAIAHELFGPSRLQLQQRRVDLIREISGLERCFDHETQITPENVKRSRDLYSLYKRLERIDRQLSRMEKENR